MQAQIIKILLKEGIKKGIILKALKLVFSPFSPYEFDRNNLSQALFCVKHYIDYFTKL